MDQDIQIKELVEFIARSLAEHPEQVVVKEVCGQQISVIELRAAKEDLGKIIGKEGRNAHAIRTIVNAAATKLKKRAVLEILE
ncbi:MAG: KH domain-containing protein [Syntrophobacter sp.]